MALPQRTIEELECLYDFEKGLRDVYVEGASDQGFYRWWLEHNGCERAIVYEVCDVVVPSELIHQFGEDVGNRGRVVALATELDARCESGLSQVSCVIDRDLGDFFDESFELSNLLVTDYCSVEMYASTEGPIRRFTHVYGLGGGLDPAQVLADVCSVTEDLFSLRLAKKDLCLDVGWTGIEKSLQLSGGRLVLDFGGFAARILCRRAGHASAAVLCKRAREWKMEMVFDSRKQMNGHDFVSALAFVLRKQCVGKQALQRDIVGRALLLCANEAELQHEPMLVALIARTSP